MSALTLTLGKYQWHHGREDEELHEPRRALSDQCCLLGAMMWHVVCKWVRWERVVVVV